MTRRITAIASPVGAAMTGIFIGMWLAGGSHVIGVYTSPDRTEQLEIDTPQRWQRPLFRRGITPAVARLTSLQEDRVVAESGVFDFGGGIGDQIYWRRDVVQVSTVAIYRRATGTWEIAR